LGFKAYCNIASSNPGPLSPNPSSVAGYCGGWTNWEKNLIYNSKKEARPLKNAQFCSSSRKAKILTTGIH
jgi:hypothetical protein